jgi:predicted ATPase
MSIKLKFDIENIGNIDKATVTIKPLTIIAGENSTGKTFITKSLYTILDSVYKNHFFNEFLKVHIQLENSIIRFYDNINPVLKDSNFYTKYTEIKDQIETDILYELSKCKFKKQSEILQKHNDLIKWLELVILNYTKDRLSLKKFQKYDYALNEINDNLESFLAITSERVDVIIDNIANSLEEGFKKNFQITNLNNLIQQGKSKKLKLKLDNLGNIDIENNESIQFDLSTDGIEEIQDVENIVFFDSPVYIKIRKALQNCQNNRFGILKEEDKYLKGYPQYLDRLYNFIDKEYIDKSEFNLISQEIQEIINGSFSVSKSGDIQYTDKKNNIMPLSLTAMGISNIGLIDLLLRNNVINKGSFLIMDEPEVHLHPEWQVVLANILYKIAKQGANIIIATHSLDFLKAFEVLLKNEEENAEEIIAINKMPFNKEFSKKTELEKVNEVLDDLSKPFYNLYMQDI